MTRKTITLELEIETRQEAGSGETTVFLSHPDLRGTLHFSASSQKMVELQLADIDANKEDADPINRLINSANKLIDGVSELKDTLIAKK